MAADPTRRRVLTAGALAALTAAGAAGCAPGHPWPWANPPKPAPDVTVLRDAITAEDDMISRYAAVISAQPTLARTVSPLLRQHQVHAAQLRQRLLVPAGAASSPATAPRPHRARVPAGPPAALEYLRAAERDRAAALVAGLARTMTPSLAQLLASIGACEATHAALLRSAGRHR